MNDIFFDKNFNRKILKKWVSSQTSMLTENNGVTYIEKIENQVNDSGQSSIVPYGADELEIYENILTPNYVSESLSKFFPPLLFKFLTKP